MGRIPDGNMPKLAKTITIDQEIDKKFREICAINNFSSWVEEQMRQEIFRLTLLYECPCGVLAPVQVWQAWGKKCPECHENHSVFDKRTKTTPRFE